MKIPQIKKITKLPKKKVIQPSDEEYPRANAVPVRLSNHLLDLNHQLYNTDIDVYKGREKEIKQIFNSLLKTNNPNVVLLGERGVGKSATVNSVVHHVLKKDCPEVLKDNHFLYWNIERFIAYTSNSVTVSRRMERKIEDIHTFATSCNNLVLVIDQIHLMAASSFLLYYLDILLNSSLVKVIGMSTPEEFYTYFSYDTKTLAKMDIVDILEPKAKKVYPMISEHVKVYEERHGVKISEDMVNYTVSVSTAFASEMCNPGLTLNFIEKSMIYAKGCNRNEVTKQDVNSNFNFDYELYEEMSPADKKLTAYHEAGHFLVSKLSENIKNFKTTAITIVPSDSFLGITLFEFEPEKQTSLDIDFYVDSIAIDLGGRVAEGFLNENGENRFTSGARSDLRSATQTARRIITEYGMIESSQNVSYFCNYDLSDIALLSEDRKKIIDEETHKLIKKAFERATDILTKNKKLLDRIAQELLSNEVLDHADLERICSETIT